MNPGSSWTSLQRDSSKAETAARLAAGRESLPTPRMKLGRAMLVLRGRFAEAELAVTAARGVQQYVMLGAGFDTFAYTQPAFARGRQIFAVDHPATQAWKRARLAAAGIAEPANLHWAPVDFERDTLAARLDAAGFDASRPSFFS